MRLRDFLKRHPVSTYFILVFAVSWIADFAVGWPKFIGGEPLGFGEALLMFIPTLTGPSIVGIALTGIVDGREGLHDLLARMGRWRVGWRWYSALLIFPILILAVAIVLAALVSSDFAPYFFATGIGVGLFSGFFEEIGWTGYAFPRMQLKQNALKAALVLGVLHGLWHLVPDYLGASVARGTYWLPHFAMFVLSMTAMRVLLTWVYSNTKSVLLGQLMHASSTGFLSILVPLSLSPANDTLFYAVYAVALWAVVALVVAKYGKHLIRQQADGGDLRATQQVI